MIQHIVLLKWKPGTTGRQIEQVTARAQELVDGIDTVEQITFGRNRARDDHGYTHALIVRLPDEAALTAYLDNPLRQRYVEEVIGPIGEELIEIDIPEDAHLERHASPSMRWDWSRTRHSASAEAAALRWEETHPDS